MEESLWAHLPQLLLYNIFTYLSYKEVIKCGRVCKHWLNSSRDNLLWKRLFKQTFKLETLKHQHEVEDWFDEFKSLHYHVPIVLTETLREHKDEVVHVSFSHDGNYFSTCSKDGFIILWNSEYPATIKDECDMRKYSWMYTQYSEFNESDTLLLVSGVYFGPVHNTSGEIAVFSVKDFILQCRITNKPYDIFGTWYCDQYLISGRLYWLAHLISTSHLYLNKASQEIESEHIPITDNMFRFYNKSANSVRNIRIANCPNSDQQSKELQYFVDVEDNICCCNCIQQVDAANLDEESRKAVFCICKKYELLADTEQLVDNDKFLIFTTGSKSYIPHQIGIKRIQPFQFPTRVDPGLSLKERIVLKERRKEMTPPPEINWLDYDSVSENFDKIDQVIDLYGYIVGIGVSPDNRFLYVNSRPWPQDYVISDPLEPLPIASGIDIHVYDLTLFKEISALRKPHSLYETNNEYFFIYLDVGQKYVASGNQDKFGYLWDRQHGVFLAKYAHTDVVNAAALNPIDEEMLVTVSDDHTIKIWRSLCQLSEKNMNLSDFSSAIFAEDLSVNLNFQ